MLITEPLTRADEHPPLPAPIAVRLGSFRHKRETEPVEYDDHADTWHVYRYADVLRVLTDARHFGAARGAHSYFSALSAFSPSPPINTQRHAVVRTLLQEALDPRTVLQLQPYVEHTAGELLDPLLAAGKLEVMRDLARPLATAVLVELLGVPVDDRAHLDWSPAYTARLVTAAASDLQAQAPQQNLIGRLLSVEVGGDRLTVDEVTAACYCFMTAAHRALADLLGNTLLLLSLYPEVLARLQREPAPVYSTVEEALRYLPPVWTAQRTVIAPHPLALAGQDLPPGAQVCAWRISANHDPAQFAQPDHFDIERIPNRHLSFADNGPFSRLGAGLARLVDRLALTAIAQRISDLELTPGNPVAVAAPPTPEDDAGAGCAVGPPAEGAPGPAGQGLLTRCSLTNLAVVFDARKPSAA